MQKEKLTDFDLQIRSMLEGAEEEVPSRVWDAVSARIDRPKVVTLWWRRAAAGVAVAAVIVSAVLISTHQPQTGDVQTTIVAESVQDEPVIPSIEEQISASSASLTAESRSEAPTKASGLVPDVISSPEDIYTAAEETVEPVESVETAEPAASVADEAPAQADGAASDQTWTDPFDALPEEESIDEGRHLSFSLQGNVMNNDRAESGIAMQRAAGTNTITKTGVTEKSQSTYGVPLTLGIGVRYHFNDKLSLGTGINYSMLTRSFTGIYNVVGSAGEVTKSVNSEIYNELHYVGVPLNLYYNLISSRDMKFYVYGGGTVEKGLTNKYRIYSTPSDIHYSENVNGLQFSTNAGLGVEFALGRHFGLYLDPSVHYYFDCDQPNSVRTQRRYMFNFEAGLRFNL